MMDAGASGGPAFVQLSGISLAFGDRQILKDVTLNLSSGSRCALTGANGCGKTTLMKIIAGKIKADSGSLTRRRGARVSYLPQSGVVHSGSLLLDEVERAFDPMRVYLEEIENIEKALARVTEESPETPRLLETLHHHQEYTQNSGYWSRGEKIDMVLRGLGFSGSDMKRHTGEFSGGWQMRIALAKVLLEDPDILLLDEPTNYLDIEARGWLKKFLDSFTGGVLIVSHDRWLLDAAVKEVAEIFCARLTRYAGNYTAYERRRAQEVGSLMDAYRRQQEEIARQEEFINRFRYNASKAAMVQSRVKQLEKIVRIEAPESVKRIHFSFPPAPASGRWVMRAENISKNYGGPDVLSNLSFELERGEKLVVAGRNGAGKSTLLRVLAGRDSSFSGRAEPGAGVRMAYFSQDEEAALDNTHSVEEEIESVCPTQLFPKIRSMLGAFLFQADDIYKSVSVLSGGERSRLALLKMLLFPANLLILDEPTNHLDMNSKDALLDALRQFGGAVIFVSHDRYFIESLATKVLELRAGQPARLFPGRYEYYLFRLEKEEEAFRDTGGGKTPGSVSAPRLPAAPAADLPGINREEQKQRKALIRKLERREEEILARIGGLEARQREIMAEMARPETYADGGKMKNLKDELERAGQQEAALHAQWEQAGAQLEAAKAGL
ncbi:MAG: ABC-F family ATP-binding cassette domain-containing protein [Spirochaetales bacterium]|jgi:ATP-binding cassette subfamily F protein 3|nr:ABC-F family ATP-binding cassette domain-containing protein [Spirochaetales bacterium]